MSYLVSNTSKHIFLIFDDKNTLVDVVEEISENFIKYLTDSAYTIKPAPVVSFASCDNFDIIENDKDKLYGLSTVYPRENDYVIDMFVTRLSIDDKTSYDAAYEELSENGKCVWNESSSIYGAVQHHLDEWFSNADFISDVIYNLTDAELIMLLKNGFSDKRIFVNITND